MEVWVVRGWFRFVVLRYWIFFGCLNIDVRFLEDTVTDRNRCMRFHCARAPPPLQLWSSGDSWWHVLSARPSIPSGEKCFCALQSVVQWCNTGIYTARSQGFSILSLPLHSISKFNYSLLLSYNYKRFVSSLLHKFHCVSNFLPIIFYIFPISI